MNEFLLKIAFSLLCHCSIESGYGRTYITLIRTETLVWKERMLYNNGKLPIAITVVLIQLLRSKINWPREVNPRLAKEATKTQPTLFYKSLEKEWRKSRPDSLNSNLIELNNQLLHCKLQTKGRDESSNVHLFLD